MVTVWKIFLYGNSLGRKCYNLFLIDQELVNEVNDLSENRMIVYNCEWDQIICIKAHLYISYVIVLTNIRLYICSAVKIVHILNIQVM